MRRIGFLLLALCLTVGTIGAIGCGGGEDTGGGTTPPADSGTDDTATDDTAAE